MRDEHYHVRSSYELPCIRWSCIRCVHSFTVPRRFFGPQVDDSALHYCQLANDMLHELNPDVITIADDVSQYHPVSLLII